MKESKYQSVFSLRDMDYGYISNIITLTIINIAFYYSFCCLNSFSDDKYQDTDMSNCIFTILIRQNISLHYFRTNTTLHRIGTQRILCQCSFININQCFFKLSGRRENVFFDFQSCSFLIAYYTLYSRAYWEKRTAAKHNKYCSSSKEDPFSLLWIFFD